MVQRGLVLYLLLLLRLLLLLLLLLRGALGQQLLHQRPRATSLRACRAMKRRAHATRALLPSQPARRRRSRHRL
jgi:hypothetical protein